MNKLFSKIKLKIKSNLQGVAFDGVVLVFILGTLILIISSNTIRVFINGKSNYTTFLQEKEELDKLQSRNDKLAIDLQYYSSNEYKQLFLRDSQNLGQNGEQLYNTKEKPKYYQEIPEYLDIKNKTNFADWWLQLLR